MKEQFRREAAVPNTNDRNAAVWVGRLLLNIKVCVVGKPLPSSLGYQLLIDALGQYIWSDNNDSMVDGRRAEDDYVSILEC